MSSSSAHSNTSSPDTLLQLKDNIKEHGGTLLDPKDILSKPPKDLILHPESSTMFGSNRSKGRIFNASDPNTTIDGLILTNGVTNANLYAIVEIIVIAVLYGMEAIP